MKVTLQDGRQMVGQMLAFDKVRRPVAVQSRALTKIAAHEPRPR
jgi:hypothetical protein